MKPMAIDAIQMTQESLPTVAATAPMENSTRGGTPLATQKAPVQSMPRSRPPPLLATASLVATSAVELMVPPLYIHRRGRFDPVDTCAKRLKPVQATPSDSVQDKTSKIIFVVHRRFQRCLPRCRTWRR